MAELRISGWRIAYGVAALLVAIFVGALTYDGQLTARDFGAAVLALTGTFAGAWLAFRRDQVKDQLEQERREADKAAALQDRHVSAIHRATFVLAMQQNELRQVWSVIKPYEKLPGRAIVMPAMFPPGGTNTRLPQSFDDLMFLVDMNEGNLLFEMFINQARYDAAIEVYERRMHFHADDLQTAMMEKNLTGKRLNDDIALQELGAKMYHTAVKLANDVFDQVVNASKDIKAGQDALVSMAQRRFPGRRFVRFELVEDVVDREQPMNDE